MIPLPPHPSDSPEYKEVFWRTFIDWHLEKCWAEAIRENEQYDRMTINLRKPDMVADALERFLKEKHVGILNKSTEEALEKYREDFQAMAEGPP